MGITKVKICGVTNLDDALLAVEAGADMLGFNFYRPSPRFVEPAVVMEIVREISPQVESIGVFVNESVEETIRIAELCGIRKVQLHGDETPEFVAELRSRADFRIIKALRVSPEFEPGDVLKYETDGVLLDAFSSGSRGGTGEQFDWTIAREAAGYCNKLFLAGGLNAANVAEAVRFVRPYAVDVANGVESSPGKKDGAKVKAFINNAKNA